MVLTFSNCSGPPPLTSAGRSAVQSNANRTWRCVRREVFCGVLDTIRQKFGEFGAGSKGAYESRLLQAIVQETLFILRQARWFGTEAGDVYQVVRPFRALTSLTLSPDSFCCFIIPSLQTVSPAAQCMLRITLPLELFP